MIARARCVLGEAEIALVSRYLSGTTRMLALVMAGIAMRRVGQERRAPRSIAPGAPQQVPCSGFAAGNPTPSDATAAPQSAAPKIRFSFSSARSAAQISLSTTGTGANPLFKMFGRTTACHPPPPAAAPLPGARIGLVDEIWARISTHWPKADGPLLGWNADFALSLRTAQLAGRSG